MGSEMCIRDRPPVLVIVYDVSLGRLALPHNWPIQVEDDGFRIMDELECSRTCLYSRSLLDTRRGQTVGGVAVPLASRQTNNRRLLGSRDNLCDHTSRSIKFSPPTAVLPVSAPTMPKWTKRFRFLTQGFRGQHIVERLIESWCGFKGLSSQA